MFKLPRKPLIQSDALADCLLQIVTAGRQQGLTAADIATRAGLAPETVSRMKGRRSGDFGAVEKMAAVVGLQFALVPRLVTSAKRITDGAFFD